MLSVFIIVFSHCSGGPNEIINPVNDTIYIRDTVTIRETVYIDTTNNMVDSLQEELFVAKYKLERIRYYTEIVDKKSSQIKFYKGWIKRVLRD